MIVQGLLVKPITARFGERRTLLTGLLCGAMGFAIYGLAPTPIIYCIDIPVMAFWGLAGPSTQGLMTRRVSPSEQGQLQGAITSLTGIAGLIGPSLFTETFAAFIGPQADWHLPGAPFLLASLLLLLGMALAWRVTEFIRRPRRSNPQRTVSSTPRVLAASGVRLATRSCEFATNRHE
jgi:DHA1 family tetracycline resistance protein-like MFS transporter